MECKPRLDGSAVARGTEHDTEVLMAKESLTIKERFITSKVLYELKQGGIKLNFVEPTKRVLISAITLGSSITDAKKQIGEIGGLA